MKHKIFTTLVIFLFSFSIYPQSREPITQTRKTDTCKLDISESPSLRGIKLGMSLKEISTKLNVPVIPEEYKLILPLTGKYAETELKYLLDKSDPIANIIITRDVKEIEYLGELTKSISVADGSKIARIVPTEDQKKNEIFDEIDFISLTLLDDRLVSILISYDTEKYKDSTNEEFYYEIFNLLGFSTTEATSKYGFVSCTEFYLSTFKVNQGLVISIYDTSALKSLRTYAIKKIRERYEMEKEKLEEVKREKAKERGFKP